MASRKMAAMAEGGMSVEAIDEQHGVHLLSFQKLHFRR